MSLRHLSKLRIILSLEFLICNALHKRLTCYAEVLCALFYAAEYSINEQLYPPQSNVDYIYNHICEIFADAFENLRK
ncbi:unnamed protein product [Gongylonema pulchrum]|uniref:NusB domain-containing protein n=1 Tax=Gongylonema pulchrum TaxID=637853 RepID=A0A183EAX4_9BILA|nr:unnamed protein product [Gongylonema pulchrum]